MLVGVRGDLCTALTTEMDKYVRQTLLWRLQILESEVTHMAEDILEARVQLAAAEEQLALMTEEHSAIAAHINDDNNRRKN